MSCPSFAHRTSCSKSGVAAITTTRPSSLSESQLISVPTVTALKFGRLTGFDGDRSLDVYVTPIDSTDDTIKAGGGFVVSAFDLASTDEVRLGTWTFSPEEARTLWRSGRLFAGFVLPCRFDEDVAAKEVIVRVTFDDLLTGRETTGQTTVRR